MAWMFKRHQLNSVVLPEIVASATEDLSFEGKQQALQQAQEQDLDARKIANIVSSRVGDIVDVSDAGNILLRSELLTVIISLLCSSR
jgi:hypothetical protein